MKWKKKESFHLSLFVYFICTLLELTFCQQFVIKKDALF